MLNQEKNPLQFKDQDVIRMMNKLRSCQQVGSPLYNKGAINECRTIYLTTVKELMGTPNFQQHIPAKILPILKSANDLSSKTAVSLKNSTFMLRRAIDILYDHFMDQFCNELDVYKQRMTMQDSREKLKVAMTFYEQESYEESLQMYEQIARGVLKMDIGIPGKNLNKIKECLTIAKSATTSKDAASLMHDCAVRLYDESRLPEVYAGVQIPIAKAMDEVVPNHKNQREEVIVNLEDGRELEAWKLYTAGDSIIGGESTYSFTMPYPGHRYGNFSGIMSRANEGGFGILNIRPNSSAYFFQITQKVLGFRLRLRNNCSNNEIYSIILYHKENQVEAFHWRADFIVPRSEDFQQVFLSIASFWPNIFGHSIGYPGQMKLGKIDAFGLSIGKNCDNGKISTIFNIGQFSLDLQSVSVVFSHDPKDENGTFNGNSSH